MLNTSRLKKLTGQKGMLKTSRPEKLTGVKDVKDIKAKVVKITVGKS